MDFVGGALPNVMFLIGIIAIGIGLGLEFKIVEVKGDLSRGGRFGAIGVGIVLVGISIYLYTTPRAPATAAIPTPSVVPTAVVQAAAVALNPTAAIEVPAIQQPTPEPPTLAPSSPTATPEPPTATPEPPTATPEPPTATPEPPTATPEPPTATPEPPTATPEPPTATPDLVVVPEIRDKSAKDAEKLLKDARLDLGERRERCDDIGMSGEQVKKVRRDRIMCQSVLPDTLVAPGTTIDYVVTGKNNDD